MSLSEKISASAYLSKLQARTEIDVDLSAQQLIAALADCCEQITACELDMSDQQVQEFLVNSKFRFVLLWSVCALQNHLDQAELGQWQTRFAECTIHLALRHSCRLVANKHAALKVAFLPSSGVPQGLFVFGMGKLGGRDLNFSSDVDLVAFFDPKVLPVPDTLGKSYICHQVLQSLTGLLGQGGGADFIWRVDWRLRPNSSANTLAMSTEAAHQYYYYQASPWHRLALMKARVVAGDHATGEAFLESLTPFLWRQNLDYRSIDELAEIKQRINLEHPALRMERRWRESISDQVAGFNLKLGSGGIREIEFVANALQLIWGGKQHELRNPNTLQALAALGQSQHLDDSVVEKLSNAYQVLRKLENAVQMIGNQHTHLLPVEPTEQEKFLILAGFNSWDELVQTLNTHRRAISSEFEGLFAEQQDSEAVVPVWPEDLSQVAKEIVREWERGFQSYGVSVQTRHRLLPLAKALADYLHKTEAHSETVIRLHQYFRSLPVGEQYFRLLAESPSLLDSMVLPLLHSPPMSSLLKQSPHIIDCFMQQPWRYPAQDFDSDYVLQAEHYEQQLERLRRFVNEHLYQLYLQFIQGELAPLELQIALSDLAEHTLNLSLLLVNKKMQLSESPVAILGLGKMGLRRMSPTSDLDLVFIYDADKTPLELASRYVSRLQTAISTPMREGIVYELDTRLRPSGRAGAPTVSVGSFAAHQLQRAHTWEHIALAPGRMVAGPSTLCDQVHDVKMKVLSGRRDPQQFIADAIKMWARIAEHRVINHPPEIMHSKLRPGGLMQSEYLAACKVIKHKSQQSNYQFDLLLESALVDDDIAHLPEIIQFWRVQQLWERLLGLSEQPVTEMRGRYLELLLAQSGVENTAQLFDKKASFASDVQASMQRLFEGLRDTDFNPEQWLESAVQWRD